MLNFNEITFMNLFRISVVNFVRKFTSLKLYWSKINLRCHHTHQSKLNVLQLKQNVQVSNNFFPLYAIKKQALQVFKKTITVCGISHE